VITGMQAMRRVRQVLFATLALFACASSWAAVFTVTSSADSGAGSLRNTIASTSPGDTVQFASGFATITLTGGVIAVPNGITITGPGANLLVVSGNASNQIFTVASGATVQISGLTLIDASAGAGGQGGAIYNQGTLSLTGMTISGNSAGDSGGGVYNSGALVIRDSTLNGNSVVDGTCAGGGAIRSETAGSSLIIVNSTITGNTAADCSGGGVSFNDGTALVVSSTIDANTAGLSGGNVYKGSAAAALTLRNTIISAGVVTGGGTPTNPDLHGAVGGGLTSLGYNLVQTPGDSTGYVASDLVSGTNPGLSTLANNGGPTETQLPTSPAVIDVIPVASCLDSNDSPLTTDQRGVARPQNGLCDIGSVELVQSAFTVSVSGSGTVSASGGSLISGGITNCSSSGANCSATYSGDPPSTVRLTATSATGYSFTAWGGNCAGNAPTCNLSTATGQSVTATFTPITYTITASAPGGNGTISTTTPTVSYGGTASFTLTPATGYYVASVTGDTCTPTGATTGGTWTATNITANCTVTASFAINTYTITASAPGGNGAISTTTPTVSYGGTASFMLTPTTGYHVASATGDTCTPTGAATGGTWAATNITANCTVTASFAINTYTVTPSAGVNGMISPNAPQTANYNATTAFTVTPSTGYTASVGGTCGGTLVGTTYTTNAVTANCTVIATFTISTYTVTPSAGANGTISPNTAQTANYNTQPTFTVTPNTGYTASVGGTCGGSLNSATNVYTTNAIVANCTVIATFTINTYTVTPSAGANGTISPDTAQTANYNTQPTFTVTPNTGYTASVGGTCGGTLVGTTYTTNAVTANCTVVASFAINTYTLTYTAGANGTITGTTPQTVSYGGSGTAVTAVPSTGYHFVQWSDGSTQNPRTDTNVTANVSVTASFAINTYTLTYTAGANGTITGTTPQTVSYGGSGTAVTAVPSTGYHFVQWSDGLTQNPRTDTNVTASISVTASFAINTYTLTYTAGANGTITGTTPQTVSYGGSGTAVTAVPSTGYHFVQWSDSSTQNPRTDTNVTANVSVTASFVINTYTVTPSAGANGTISPDTAQTANYNTQPTFAVTPSSGYTASVGGTCGGALVGTTYTTAAVMANCTVVASFAQNPPPVATPQSVNIAFATATPITLAATDNNPGGPYTFIFAVVTPPANGSVTISGATATYTPASGYAGPDSFTFTATDVNGTSAAATVTIMVAKDMTTTTLMAAPNPSVLGQTVTFTATVIGDPPTGTVTFLDGGTTLGTRTLSPGGQAMFSTSALGSGTHGITAAYSGDAINSPSVSAALPVVVNSVPVAAPMLDWRALCLFGLMIIAVTTGILRSRRLDRQQ
jgi:hypothetical protein